ncbi:methionine gamma-lyase [Haematospirillum jordaniae]|uniref:methionine gamma-lyase n=1 Tax=Haematospirillum jordaniae TaxID=1549855 RepID=UPI00143340BA|nr:methionine gamma-lyase [Haematospirillum jordaniae]NKD44491.1 methionine gamma-lyase [Haematospirillum jordaniae]NKD92192.1 methionine gamma-lyase [Haematospirillum jordaniae]
MSDTKQAGFATRAIHAGYDPHSHQGSLVPPVYMTSTFAFPDAQTGGERFAGHDAGFVYTRLGNPTLALLETRLATLEGTEAALVTGSGMGAIAATLWTLLSPGQEIIVDQTLYGCTFALLHHGLARFGVKITHVDLTNPKALPAAIGPDTAIVYFETPANPNMRLIDIAAVSAIARHAGAVTVVDNTYGASVIQRPAEMGANLVVHSATKYLGGHGDLTAGAVLGTSDMVAAIRATGLKDMTGAVLSPFDASQILRGLKTLELRMARHCSTAAAIAQLLEQHPAVHTVMYPGLDSNPSHDLAQRQMTGGYGGMVAFELHGGMSAGLAFINALRLVTCAVSLGDPETLVQHPASMTHSTYTPEERAEHGISDGLIRISAGLETPVDILDDICQALDHTRVSRNRKPAGTFTCRRVL